MSYPVNDDMSDENMLHKKLKIKLKYPYINCTEPYHGHRLGLRQTTMTGPLG